MMKKFIFGILATAFMATGLLGSLDSVKARDSWPWPLSLTCPIHVKNLEGWWVANLDANSTYFRFSKTMTTDDGLEVVELMQLNSSGKTVAYGHAKVKSGASSIEFDVYDRSTPNVPRAVYLHQLHPDDRNCHVRARETVVSFIRLGSTPGRDVVEKTYSLERSENPRRRARP